MITLSFKTTVRGNKTIVWSYYCQPENWLAWDDKLKAISLDGAFETGNFGHMTLLAQTPLKFQLLDVQEYQSFSNIASTPLGQVVFGHQIEELGVGQLSIEHSVSLLDEERADSLNFLQKVFEDVPQSVLKLKHLVEE